VAAVTYPRRPVG